MSASVLLTCNASNEYGTCPARFTADVETHEEARDLGKQAGWSIRNGKDFCPFHTNKGARLGDWRL